MASGHLTLWAPPGARCATSYICLSFCRSRSLPAICVEGDDTRPSPKKCVKTWAGIVGENCELLVGIVGGKHRDAHTEQ
eukprot:scaffold2714_cov123-Isochrysis_galbana.AAC.7